MNYIETEKYLNSLNSLGSIPGLDSIKELLKRLGNPQKDMKFVHIAGTNGKGSVNAYISSILMSAGYKTGRFISPAVRTPLEIIECDNVNISESDFSEIISEIRFVCDEMEKDLLPHPTRFEIETAAAFMYFSKMNCDLAVVECGMGGLLDSTNIITNTECAVITAISIDHTGFLGNTLSEIATHKAGIIKPECSTVTIVGEPVVNQIIREKCETNDASLYLADAANISNVVYDIQNGFNSFTYNNETYETGLLGSYQLQNVIISIECANALIKRGFHISTSDIKTGIKNTKWFGRFTKLGSKPDFIIDGAHNDEGARVLADSLKVFYPDGGLTYIMGVFKDKDYDSILQHTAEYAKTILTIETPHNPRALSSNTLAKFIEKHYDIQVISFRSIEKAVKFACDNTSKDSAVIAFGSLSHLEYINNAYRKVNNLDR